jgi:long-chain acyl-CoA synthetase
MSIIQELHFHRKMKVFTNRPSHLAGMLRETASIYPDKEALVYNNSRLTYQQMWEQVESIAGNLSANEVRQGDRVALVLGNSIEFSLLVFACARIGAIAVTLNARLQERELSYMLNHSGSSVLIVDNENVHKVENMRNARSINKMNHYFLVGHAEVTREDYIPYEQLEQPAAPSPDISISEDDPVFIMYTSGTTGLPKGAIGSHLGIIHSALNYEKVMESNAGTRTLIAVPLFHVTGLIGQLLHMVRVGGTSIIMKRYSTEEYIRLVSEERVTFLFNVPTIYVMMTTHPLFKQYSYSDVNCIAYGGAPMSVETISTLRRVFPGAMLHNAYGATETSSPATIMPRYFPDSKVESVGLPVPVAEVKTVHPDGTTCGVNEVGELLIKGPMVIEGYWQNKDANQHAFVDGYWKSGDLARIDEDGFVYIMDRIKDMINRGGEKIFSVEVENVLYNHPKVQEAAVVGVPHQLFGEVVMAVIVPKANVSISQEEIKQFVSDRLAHYKVPSIVEVVSELPRNPGGKVVKGQLKKLVQDSSSNERNS